MDIPEETENMFGNQIQVMKRSSKEALANHSHSWECRTADCGNIPRSWTEPTSNRFEYLPPEYVVEEHVTIVKEPGSKFIGYVTPTGSTGAGYRIGAVRRMEEYLNRPLQIFVCLFHFNELPLNALLKKFAGIQKGLAGIWPGKFRQQLLECENYPVSFISQLTLRYSLDNLSIKVDQFS